MATTIPNPPPENTDPWFTARDAFDQAVKTRLNVELSDSALAEATRDTMGTTLVAGTNVTITPNDVGDTITISASGGGGGGGLPALANTLQSKLYSGGASATFQGTPVADIIALTPVFLPAGMTITRLIVGAQAAAAVSQPFDVGIYDMSGALLTSASGSTGTTTGSKEVTLAAPVTLPPAMYWFAFKIRATTADGSLRMNSATITSEQAYLSRGNPWDAISSATRPMNVPHAGTGAIPASLSGLTVTEGGFSVGFAWRVA